LSSGGGIANPCGYVPEAVAGLAVRDHATFIGVGVAGGPPSCCQNGKRHRLQSQSLNCFTLSSRLSCLFFIRGCCVFSRDQRGEMGRRKVRVDRCKGTAIDPYAVAGSMAVYITASTKATPIRPSRPPSAR